MSVFDKPSRRNRIGYRFERRDRAEPIIDALYKVVADARKNAGKRGYGSQESEVLDHIDQIVTDLYAAWFSDSSLYVGYSRGSAAFRKSGSYKGQLNEDIFLHVIDSLAVAGYIENHEQDAGFKDTSSRMRCTPKLALLIEGARLNWASVITPPSKHVLVLKGQKDKKTGNRKVISIDEGDDPQIPVMIDNLTVINEKLSRTLINIAVTDDEQAEINKRLRNDPENLALDFTQRHLYRVFVNNNWDEGGRFYGGWWQGVPSEYRHHIRIQGKMTVEWDYSAIHPSILYAQKGLPRPSDAYDIPGWDRTIQVDKEVTLRDVIKKAFNQLINSKPVTKPKSRWRTLAPDFKPEPEPKNWSDMKKHQKAAYLRKVFKGITGKDYSDLLQDIIDHHEPIADVFFTQSWGRMQKLDSDIAEAVMVDLYEQGIVVLPIHDSFIVRRGFEGYLKSAMNRAYQKYVAAIPGMKSDRQEMTFDEWILPEGETGILTGTEVMEIGLAEVIKRKLYFARDGQWKSVWGSIGWD